MPRRLPIGAEVMVGGVHFRVWAPERERVRVVIAGDEHDLQSEGGGYFGGLVEGVGAGALYRFRLDDDDDTYPDPASRHQPDGPHSASMVVDPSTYVWREEGWRGVDPAALVVYEMHIGTFTAEGTWRAAAARLPALAEIGITLLEVMPANEFPGRFGWGYDGVDLFAPSRLYGRPDDFRAFVDAAHAAGLGVILDVVYNHLGPDGCYLTKFTPHYFTKKYENEWGEAVNFDGDESEGVRSFVTSNAAYWIDEFHLDGLRLDATQSLHDDSPEHIMAALARAARAAAGGRTIVIIAENEPQDVAVIERQGLDALWNDDWHHAALVAATHAREAYYTDYLGTPQEFVSMAMRGFLYQGQWYSWQKQPRGTASAHLPPAALVCFLENHDQLANSAGGARLRDLTPAGRYRALTALLLLQPQMPMLFQGQERGTQRPFLYFADHKPELAVKVREGRRDFLKQFPSIDLSAIKNPDDLSTFTACKLDDEGDERFVALHRDLLTLRRQLRGQPLLGGAVLGDAAFLLRFQFALLLVNLGAAIRLEVANEPLLAPPRGRRWQARWSSEDAAYGGGGTAFEEWSLPAESAIVLIAT
jgi:maltooligosyltrehalose trehalohydrolase